MLSRFCLRILESAFVFAALSAPSAFAQDPADSIPRFRPLFNGKDLSGWVNVNTADDTWRVENGLLVCTGKPIGVMRSEKQYENFILHIEWRHMKAGGNSGVFVWSSAKVPQGRRLPDGVEVQMLDLEWVRLHRKPDGTFPPIAYVHGELFGVGGVKITPENPRGVRSKARENRCKGKGEWNVYDVVAVDGNIKLAVNGKFVNGVRDATQRKGYLCLESEGSEIHFRNIYIMELPPSAPPASSGTEAKTSATAPPKIASSGTTGDRDASVANRAEEKLPEGHSQHGEAFNEGPRQKAYLMGGTGAVHFRPSVKHPLAAKFVLQGIGQLHGFWYFEAERTFRQVAMLEPDYAFAYWGMSMANVNNEKRAKGFIAEAVRRRDSASPLERALIDAHSDFLTGKGTKSERAKRYAETMAKIVERFPDEIEPKAFLAYLHWKYKKDIQAKPEATDRVIQQVLDVEPMHPVHHYRIHLWDYIDPKKALDSAAKCGPSAPAIAHMWHMPGHIYSRLHRYADAAWQQEASARVDHAHMMRDRVMPDQIHNFAHNNEWFIRNMVFIGRWKDALDLAMNMTELPRHPAYNTFEKRGSASYGRQRLWQVLRSYELWPQLIALAGQPYLEPTDMPRLQIERLRYLGQAHALVGNTAGAERQLEVLRDHRIRLEKQVASEKRTASESNKKNGKDATAAQGTKNAPAKAGSENTKKTKKKGRKPTAAESELGRVAKAIAAVEGYLAWQREDWEEARAKLKKAGESALVLARLESLAGRHDAATKAIAALVKRSPGQVLPLAAQVEILFRAGKQKEARKAFEALRAISGSVQWGAPPWKRLAPIAQALGLPEDWRLEQPLASDLGQRVPLDSLGPFRWSPQPAPSWELEDTTGRRFRLAQYRGKPVIVIFYLGFGCLHCAEQLKAFAPMAEEFRKKGIELIAISTDNREDLKKSIDDYPGGMPFPLVSDARLDVFRAYRVYDDFEQTPLHGTFVIDASGNVRWQDISYEPFMDPKFVLGEAIRLLDQQNGKGWRATEVSAKDASSNAGAKNERRPSDAS